MKLDSHTVQKIEQGRAQLELALSNAHDALTRTTKGPVPPREALSVEICLTAAEFEEGLYREAGFGFLKERLWALMLTSPHFRESKLIFGKYFGRVWRRIKVDQTKLPQREPTKPFELSSYDLKLINRLNEFGRKITPR